MFRQFVSKIRSGLSFSNLVGTISMTDEQEKRLNQAQLRNVTDMTSITVLANLLNVAVLVLTFWATDLSRLITLWGTIMCAVLAYIVFKHVRHIPGAMTNVDPERGLSNFTRGATILGFLWGIVPLFVLPFADNVGFTAVGMLLTGTMFGGVLLIGRIPAAAMGLVMPIIVGILVGLQFQQDPHTDLLSIMALAYAGVLYFASRMIYTQFAQQHLGREALEEQTELIEILLSDFEENTSDWLWETNAEGVFTPLTPDKANQVRQNTQVSDSNTLIALAENKEGGNELIDAIAAQRPFKDFVIKACNSPAKWLSVTGKPIFTQGVFHGYRGVASDVTQAKTSEERLAFLAHFDTLTQLPNRSSLADRLNEISSDTSAWDGEYALAWLDLDNFKWVNDTLGHQAGDEILRGVAVRLRKFAQDEGLLARISGDEFAVIEKFHDSDGLTSRMDALVEVLSEPYNISGSSVLCRASIGVKVIGGSGFDADNVLKHADLALYTAKEHDKGSWALFDQKLEDKARSMRELEVDLNNALERNELRIYFQPIVDAHSHEVVACETLLRWQHPRKGLLTPAAFIQFAEDSGVITRLGDWVIRQALSEARRLPDHIRIAVNISPLQIHSAGLVPTIINSLATNGIDPSRLELEITESVMISDTEFTMQRLQQLKDLGLRIALDDFGTGFSSMSYLRKFPFDKLKVDKSFTEELETHADTRAITQATLQLAKALGMRCTGEGVETPKQGEFLRDHGCDELQGYMFSRPQPLESLGHMIDLKDLPLEATNESVVALSQPAPAPVETVKTDIKKASAS